MCYSCSVKCLNSPLVKTHQSQSLKTNQSLNLKCHSSLSFPKSRPQNPSNPRLPRKAPLLHKNLYKAYLLLSLLLFLPKQRQTSSCVFPNKSLCEICCAVWLCGVPWSLMPEYLSSQSCGTSTGETFPLSGVILTIVVDFSKETEKGIYLSLYRNVF